MDKLVFTIKGQNTSRKEVDDKMPKIFISSPIVRESVIEAAAPRYSGK